MRALCERVREEVLRLKQKGPKYFARLRKTDGEAFAIMGLGTVGHSQDDTEAVLEIASGSTNSGPSPRAHSPGAASEPLIDDNAMPAFYSRLTAPGTCSSTTLATSAQSEDSRLHPSTTGHSEADKCKGVPRGTNDQAHGSVSRKSPHSDTKPSRPFTCLTCYKSFSRRTNLNNHQRTQTSETPYTCDFSVCEQCFRQKNEKRRQQKILHGDEMFECGGEGGCSKRFARKDGLLEHRRKTEQGKRSGGQQME